jgi:hypothetical protein
LDAFERGDRDDVRKKIASLSVKHDTNSILGEGPGVGMISLSILRCGRIEVGILRPDGQDNEDDADGADVSACEQGAIGVGDIDLLSQPVPINIEVISLGMLEKSLDEEVGHISRRQEGERGDRIGRGLELLSSVVFLDLGRFVAVLINVSGGDVTKNRR